MGVIIKMPLVNANDDRAELVSWLVSAGQQVAKGSPICVVETTKSAVEVNADASGIISFLVDSGQVYGVGTDIAFIASDENDQYVSEAVVVREVALPSVAATIVENESRFTKKAFLLAKRFNIDLEKLAADNPGRVVNEEMIIRASKEGSKGMHPELATKKSMPITAGFERVLILGGGGGAALVIDILSRSVNQKPIGILDNNPFLKGSRVMGVPVIGGFDIAEELWKNGLFDGLISTVVRNVNERENIFKQFSSLGIPFVNVVDPEVRLGREVVMGTGNLIIYGGYLATSVVVGNNNFLAAGTFVEHHSHIGSHCTFGPRSSLSGKVNVGDRVKFGTGVLVEPELNIGEDSIIASGVVLTSNIPASSIVKSSVSPLVRSKK